MSEICKEAGRPDGYPMTHEYDVVRGEIGDNGYAHETWKCAHCGKVDKEYTPEEVERLHVTDLIHAGDVTENNLSEEALEKDWVQDALAERKEREAA